MPSWASSRREVVGERGGTPLHPREYSRHSPRNVLFWEAKSRFRVHDKSPTGTRHARFSYPTSPVRVPDKVSADTGHHPLEQERKSLRAPEPA